MTAPWEQNLQMYFAIDRGAPVQIMVDMAADDHVPVATHPTLARVVVQMKRPDEDGRASSDEAAPLFALQTAFVASFEERLDAIFWGRRVGDGNIAFLFQVPAEAADAARFDEAVVPTDYEFQVEWGADPEWQEYRSMYPTAFHLQTMWNRQTTEQLEDQGDVLTKRRRVDHLAFFPSLDAARAAVRPLKRARFRVGRPSGPDEEGRFALGFTRKDAIDEGRPDETTIEIFEAIEPSGGVYDGWGCMVTS